MHMDGTGDGAPRLFEALRREDRGAAAATGGDIELVVQLLFDDQGAYLQVVDAQGRPREFDYRRCRGALRDLLKALGTVQRRQEDLVGWGGEGERLYLHTHGHLLWLLRACGSLVDASLRPLAFAPGPVEIVLKLARDRRAESVWLAGELLLVRDGAVLAGEAKFRFINETHVLAGDRIYETPPVGESFRLLSLFGDSVPEAMLERALSLLFSHFSGIAVRYEDYRTVEGEDLHTQASVLFQSVDETGALHFDLAHTIPQFPVEFVRQYDITRAVMINEAERTLVVRNVVYVSLEEERQALGRLLSRHQKELASDDLSALLYADDDGFILGKALAEHFLARELSALARRYVLFGAERLKAYRVRAATPKLKLRLGHGIDFLEADATLEIEGQTFTLLDVLAQYRKHAYVALSDGAHAVLDPGYLAKLARLFRKHEEGVRVSFFDLPLVDELVEQRAETMPLCRARDVFLGFNTLAGRTLPAPPIAGALRPYQSDGLRWLDYLREHRLGGCLADDMGLGKTVQTIALLARIYPGEPTPSLLVMPRSLLFNWQREIERFCPVLRPCVYHGPGRDLDEAMTHPLVLTTYGTLRNDIERFVERRFHYAILDESQAIKNADSQIARAALLLKAECRLALSGTPIENNLGELYSLFRFLNPAMFGSAGDFERDYAAPIHQHDDKEAARELRKKIYPFILRRLKRDVLKDLPDKVEQVLYVDMSPEQRRLYQSRRRFYYETVKRRIGDEGLAQSRFFILEALLELRQLASIPEAKSDGVIVSPKREALVESVQDAVLNGHKALVFTNFLTAIELLSADLEARGIRHLIMTGAVSNREALVQQFQTNEAVKVFLMTLKTGGVGLNLTAADTVFIFDPWWNTAAELQAVDRTHRIGQDRTVFTYKLIARDSIEEKIVQLQERKKRLFDAIIASDDGALKSLTEADIDDILG